MNTSLRSFLAGAVALLLVACGGGDDATDNRLIPAGARCELQLTGTKIPFDENSVFTAYSGTVPGLTFGSDGRYRLTSTDPFYVAVYVRTPEHYWLMRGFAQDAVTLSADLAYSVSYAPIIGTVRGQPLIGQLYQIPKFGGSVIREVVVGDVLGLEDQDRPLAMQEPQTTFRSDTVFEVSSPFAPGSSASDPQDQRYTIYVGEYCYHCAKPAVYSCSLRGVKYGEPITLVNVPRGQGITLSVQVYPTVMLDDGREAIGTPNSFLLEY